MEIENSVIRSRRNPLIVKTAALLQRKGRAEAGRFLLEGEKLVREAAAARLPVEHVFLTENRTAQHLAEWNALFAGTVEKTPAFHVLSEDCFSKISSEKAPQGVIAVVKYLDFFRRRTIIYDEDLQALSRKRVILLYDMQDPGNLGTIVRSAVAFGTNVVILSAKCADLYHPRALRAAMGTLFHTDAYIVEDFFSAVRGLQKEGRRVLCASLAKNAVRMDRFALRREDCIVIGNEGHGIPSEVTNICDGSLYLPISDCAESLNAAAAAAVFLWELQKCR